MNQNTSQLECQRPTSHMINVLGVTFDRSLTFGIHIRGKNILGSVLNNIRPLALVLQSPLPVVCQICSDLLQLALNPGLSTISLGGDALDVEHCVAHRHMMRKINHSGPLAC